jgi:hypothetical protein
LMVKSMGKVTYKLENMDVLMGKWWEHYLTMGIQADLWKMTHPPVVFGETIEGPLSIGGIKGLLIVIFHRFPIMFGFIEAPKSVWIYWLLWCFWRLDVDA